MSHIRFNLKSKLVLLAAALFGVVALAQETTGTHEAFPPPAEAGDPTGVMTGLLDGEEFTLHTYLVQAGEPELSNTAYWDDWRSIGIGSSVSISAHEVAGIGLKAWQGAITIDIDLSGEFEFEQHGEVPSIGYFDGISNPYGLTAGTLEVDEVQLIDDETLRMSGRFDGTFTSVLSGDEKHIAADFWFDYVTVTSPAF